MWKRFRNLRQDERGMSFVFIGIGFMAFVAASTLAIDVGMFMTARSQAQNAADGGALAGATALAFNDFDDRSVGGPAVQSAVNTALANSVIGAAPSTTPADVSFPGGPTGNNRVKVNVYRTGARSNAIPTLIGPLFSVPTVDIAATATAEASPANAMTCVKPFTIPDKWVDSCTLKGEICPFDPTDSFERYDNKGNVITNPDTYYPAFNADGSPSSNYSGYNTAANKGMTLVLRASTGTNIQPSFYFSLAMLDSMGGDDYRWNIANCNHSIYHWGDLLTQEPGSKEGPTVQGILALIAEDPNAYWDVSSNSVKGSAFGERQSPRIFPIPLYDPDYYNAGMMNGRVASLKTANWIGFFVEYVGSYSDIHGRIIPIAAIRDRTFTNPGMYAFPKVIRLVQ